MLGSILKLVAEVLRGASPPELASDKFKASCDLMMKDLFARLQWLLVAGFGVVFAGVGPGRGRGLPGRPKRKLNRPVRVD